MKDQVLVKVENLSKKFCRSLKRSLWYGARDIVAELTDRRRSEYLRPGEFWALDDISFELRRGEALGIIGPNGAGKTTLLRLLNGLIKPDRGSIRMRGRVQALIALGAGFNPILTGRENVYVNAAIFGIPKKQVDCILDEIVAFSEIGEFIDAPVQTYSSGMIVRLGFAVAIHVKPDVLIIDEVLAVGDQRFRRKARNAMQKLLDSDVGLIFISHNLHEVMGITDHALWIDKGQLMGLGKTPDILNKYRLHSDPGITPMNDDQFVRMNKRTGELSIERVCARVENNVFKRKVQMPVEGSRELEITLEIKANARFDEYIFYVSWIKKLDGDQVGYVTFRDHVSLSEGDIISRKLNLILDFLHPGTYVLDFCIDTEGGPRLDGIKGLVYLTVPWRKTDPENKAFPYMYFERMQTNNQGAVRIPSIMEIL
jgi:ABC-type polysaccharide/polyol phosphate transport system ATPase subunit